MSAILRNLLPAIPGRSSASDKAEMVTQLLYGEHFELLTEEEKWVEIRCLHDDYRCWIDRRQVDGAGPAVETPDILPHDTPLDISWGVPFLFAGSRLTEEESVKLEFTSSAGLEAWCKLWVGSPYLWGGRNRAGVDCSGFVQVAFAVHGQDLPRDAWQQAERGEEIAFIQEATTGDLAFFDNAEGRITHVGIVLQGKEGAEIIHASGQVRIDRLDHQGIFDQQAGKYTHQLRIIKRV